VITNGEFVSFHGPDPTMIDVGKGNAGSVRFVNCAFWGPCNQIARIAGTGTVGFGDCTFTQWGGKNGDLRPFRSRAATILIRGCEFRQDRPQIQLGKAVRRAVIAENVFTGNERIVNESEGNVPDWGQQQQLIRHVRCITGNEPGLCSVAQAVLIVRKDCGGCVRYRSPAR
jgi:hypothetical protein